MLKGKIVRVRMKRHYAEQKLWVFVGKVSAITENWLRLEGKGILLGKSQMSHHTQDMHLDVKGHVTGQMPSVEIDDEARSLVLPRDNIANIRILPDSFNLGHIELCTEGIRVGLRVDGAPNTWIGEVGEG